jgi:hypothetical protein
MLCSFREAGGRLESGIFQRAKALVRNIFHALVSGAQKMKSGAVNTLAQMSRRQAWS